MIDILLDNRVRLQRSQTPKDVISALQDEFKHSNPEIWKMRKLGFSTKGIPEHFITWDQTETGISFPRGGLQRVREVLTEFGLEWEIDDQRTEGAPDARGEIPDHLLKPYDYQEECVGAAIEREQGIIKAPTGSGKTVMVFAAISRIKLASLVVVPNKILMRQWLERIPIELGLDIDDIGMIQGSKMKLRPITLAMVRTLYNRVGPDADPKVREMIADYFGVVACDEAQLFAAETFFNAIDPLPARYRLAVSADHTRKDRKEFLIYDIFTDVVKSITRKRLIKQGAVLDVEIWVIPTDFCADWYGVPEDEDDDHHIDFDRLLNLMLMNDDRNKLAYKVIDETIKEGNQILAFSHRREHCLTVDRTLSAHHYRTGFLLGGPEDEREFVKTLDGLKSGSLDVGVGTYQSTGTGLDLPRIGVGLAMTPIAGNRQFFGQVRGRFCRTIKDGSTEKTTARLYYLWDRNVYPKHLRNLVAWNDKVFIWTGTSWTSARHYLELEEP